MTLKIEKEFVGRKTVIRLSGRLQSEHVDELRAQLADAPSDMALDLEAVTLVDVEVVRFLSVCEESGIELLQCPPYVRVWMVQEQNQKE